MDLFVWGEGFDLPSIDPECIAILAYLSGHYDQLPFEVKIHAGYDPTSSPSGDFPLLHCSADNCENHLVSGFLPIIRHLRSNHEIEHSPRRDAMHDAYNLALFGYVSSRGRQLLDLYLYVSYDNYYSATSAAWTTLLPWYANYIIPLAKRRTAIARTEHLGVTSLDVDNVHDLPLGSRARSGQSTTNPTITAVGSNTAAAAMIADNDRRKRMSAHDRAAQSDVFRLRRLADSFFEVISSEVGTQRKSDYISHKRLPEPLDYLIFGYLSIITHAPVPNKWLANILTGDHNQLRTWTVKFFIECFGRSPGANVESANQRLDHFVTMKPQERSTAAALSMVGQAILRNLPVVNQLYSTSYVIAIDDVDKGASRAVTKRLQTKITGVWRSVATIGLGLTVTVGIILINHGVLLLPQRLPLGFAWRRSKSKSASSLQDFGEAGSFLSALGHQMQFNIDASREHERLGGATVAAAEVNP